MAEVLDVNKLLAEFPGEFPAGVNPRAKGVPDIFGPLKNARQQAIDLEKAIENLAPGEKPSREPDWRPVFKLSVQVLQEVGKDLQVGAWLVEAATRLHGLDGLRDSFAVLRGLVERFAWPALFPPIEDGDHAARTNPIAGLGNASYGTITLHLRLLPLTDPTAAPPITADTLERAHRVANYDPEQRTKALSNGQPNLPDVLAKAKSTAKEFFLAELSSVTKAQTDCEALSKLLDDEQRCGTNGPNLSGLLSLLQKLAESIKELGGIAEEEVIVEQPIVKDPGGGNANTSGGATTTETGSTTVLTLTRDLKKLRQQKLDELIQIAVFFEETEPHSPLPTAIKRAVEWAKLPLHKLWEEMIVDENLRASIFRLIGACPTGPLPPGNIGVTANGSGVNPAPSFRSGNGYATPPSYRSATDVNAMEGSVGETSGGQGVSRTDSSGHLDTSPSVQDESVSPSATAILEGGAQGAQVSSLAALMGGGG